MILRMIAFVLYTVYLFEYDLPIDELELEIVDSCSCCHIHESISWYTNMFDTTIRLELELSDIVPGFYILESLGVWLEYPYAIPIEYICIGEVAASDKYTIFARIYTPFSWDFIECDGCEGIFVSCISEDLAIVHIEIYSSIDTEIKYPWLELFHES